MNTLLAAVRAVHYASAMLLLGELVFALLIAGPVLHGDRRLLERGPDDDERARRRLSRILCWSVVASVVSAVVWLLMTAAIMSGLPVEALGRDTVERVLGDTSFGRVWTLRLGLLVTFCVPLAMLARVSRESPGTILRVGMLALAAAYLAALAWTGHAAAGDGLWRDVAIASDVVHLLAGGAWLGALPAFVFLLGGELATPAMARVTQRFSALGMICVAALAASGFGNAWTLVGSVPALFATGYGRLLLAKIALFGGMLALAAANRWYHAVLMADGDRAAQRRLRRSAMQETVLGGGVVAVAGLLGVTVPAAHQALVWPFEHTLSVERLAESLPTQAAVAATAIVACAGVAALFAGLIRRRGRLWLAGLAAVLASPVMLAALLAVPAHPMTYAVPAVDFTTEAIVRGRGLYEANCASCHGPRGRGDGAAGRALPIRPADLTEHAARHAVGDLYWWIAHGIRGTPMPAFAPALEEADIWNVVQYVRALSEAREATATAQEPQALPPMSAPDFTFELAGRAQESLRQLRGTGTVLLVLYTLPQSLPRLTELAGAAASYGAARVRVIALPLRGAQLGDEGAPVANAGAFAARASPSVATAYGMFARAPANLPDHVEFLIDRQGDLRFRWDGIVAGQAAGTSGVLGRAGALNRESPRRAATTSHRH